MFCLFLLLVSSAVFSCIARKNKSQTRAVDKTKRTKEEKSEQMKKGYKYEHRTSPKLSNNSKAISQTIPSGTLVRARWLAAKASSIARQQPW